MLYGLFDPGWRESTVPVMERQVPMDPKDLMRQQTGPSPPPVEGPPRQGSGVDREADYVDFTEVEPDGSHEAVSRYQ